MWRKDLMFVLGICALILCAEIALVVVFGSDSVSGGSPNTAPTIIPTPAFNKIMPPGGRQPLTRRRNSLIKMTDVEAARQFGPPVSEFPGMAACSDPVLAQKHPQAKTLMFAVSAGYYYAFFDKVGSAWVCIGSEYFSDDRDDLVE